MRGATRWIETRVLPFERLLLVCFAVIVRWPMARLVTRWPARVAWRLYPLLITFVVVVTRNHYLTDVMLGVLTAAISALRPGTLLARARPDAWALAPAAA